MALAALSGGGFADAQSQPRDERPHLLVVPDTAEGEAALARADARAVARYDSFTLVEADGADDTRLRAAGADRRDDMRTVTTAAGELDPATARRSLAAKEAPDRDEVLALVQFVGPPKDAWLDRLRATGARIVSYQAENGYVVHAAGDEVDRLAELVGTYAPVRAVAAMTSADKLESSHSPTGRYAVQTVAGAEGADARRDAAAAAGGGTAGTGATIGELQTQYLALTGAEAASLARDPAVVAIEPDGEPQLADERAAQIVAGDLTAGFAPSGPGYLDWLVDPDRIPDPLTFDFAIDVTDTGFDNGDAAAPAHPDFRRLGALESRVSYVANYTSETGGKDCDGHGTNVASIAAGYNDDDGAPAYEDLALFNHGLGIAPFAKIGASKIFRSCGDGLFGLAPGAGPIRTLTRNAYAAGARISNNSWGNPSTGYTARAQEYDSLVRDARTDVVGNQEMVEVFAAGNNGADGYGTILAEAAAKNVITVGASEGVRASGRDGCGVTDAGADGARDIAGFSSRGPTTDGRLKPDLVAPGSHITGARPQHPDSDGDRACTDRFGGPFYNLISGTSQAAPQVSGAAALVRHWYKRTQPARVPPSAALTKALLINTATDLAGGDGGKGAPIGAGPNTDQGWGRVNVGAALDSTERVFHDQAETLRATGEAGAPRAYRADDTGAPVKVTLVWTDAPGDIITGNVHVNNLDLEVEGGGRRYLGNVFGGTYSRLGGDADTRNNVESVYLPAGAVDRFTVTVKGANIAGDGVPGNPDLTDQDFALVVSNATESSAPVLVGGSTAISDSLPEGDGDGVLESDEEIELTQPVRNAGSAGATGVSATLTSDDLEVTQASSSYPDLAAGATRSNAQPFEAGLANAAACGQDVTAELGVSFTGPPSETQAIPLMLPTGEIASTPLLSDAAGAQVPRAIPDDDGAGVTSTLYVSERGRIKDLDARLGIEHTFVGDLVVDLTSPAGTIVRLVEHPGGPDNKDDNFDSTVLDDEAAQRIGADGTAAPYTGSFRPQSDQLSRFDGESRRGTWTLRVRDSFEGDEGQLLSWGLTTRKAVCDYDTTPPDTDIVGSPADPTSDTSPTFAFESPNDPLATFECRLDGGPYEPCSSPTTLSVGMGTHTFTVRAIDGSDNEDATPDTYTWATDTAPPDTAISSGPSAGSFTTSTDADFTYSSEPQSRYECSLDGGPWTACDAQPQHYSGLQAGAHTFAVRALDLAGNEDPSPATRSWTVDVVAPDPSVDTPPPATEDSQPTLTGSGTTAPGDQATVTVKIYAGTTTGGSLVHTLPVSLAADGSWSVEVPASLDVGSYTVQAEQRDSAGNSDVSAPVVFNIVADTTAPIVRLTTPPSGSTTSDGRPTIAGVAGTRPGDDGTVVVKLWSGTLAGGLPAQTMVVPRDGASGAFSAAPAALADGTYTVSAEQGDSGRPARNVGLSNVITFTVSRPPPASPARAAVAPTFAATPAEERMADALAGRYTVMAACASACRISARLSAGSKTMGRGTKRLARSGSASVKVALNRAARRALRNRDQASLDLRLTVEEGARTLTLARRVNLRRAAGLRAVARSGLGLWAVCSARCPLRGLLTVSNAQARRAGLKPGQSARIKIATGNAAAGPTGGRVVLRVPSKLRAAVSTAAELSGRLELVAGTTPQLDRSVTRALSLRR